VGRKAIVLVGLVVALAVVAAVAVAARGGGSAKPANSAKPPAFTPPAASKQYGDDADLMRRLERKKLTTRADK
jgi:hypothetical protein